LKKAFFIICLPVLIYIGACTSTPDIEIPEEIATLENLTVGSMNMDPVHANAPERVAIYGDTDDVMIGQLWFFETDHMGRVFIADGSQNVIHIYSPEGDYITKAGGEGDGPGEFRRINSITFGDGYMHVMDGQSLRISRFDLDTFAYVDDMDLPFEPDFSGGYFTYPSSFDLMEDGNYLIHFDMGYSSGQPDGEKERKLNGRILDSENGKIQDSSVYSFPASEALVRREGTSMSVMNTPYKRTSHVQYNNKTIFYGWSEELLFKWQDIAGGYLRSLYIPYEKASLERDLVIREYADRDEPWRSMVRNDQMPATWPAFMKALPDDENRVWAGLYTDDPESYTWKAFTQDGELYASFVWPRYKTIQTVRNGEIYTIETDPDTDLRQIAKYRFQ
jgi:hypothetical protein